MHLGLRSTVMAVLIFIAGFVIGQVGDDSISARAQMNTGKVFELRTYTAPDGKLPNLLARFRDHTMRIFERHGIENVAYWVPQDSPDSANTLIYLISHDSRAAAQESWDAFRSDPEWQRVAEESQVDGRIVSNIESVYMLATDFSPMK